MKKTMSFLLAAGLCWFTVGCSGDPGTTVETDMSDAEAEEMDNMGDIASEEALEAEANEAAPAE